MNSDLSISRELTFFSVVSARPVFMCWGKHAEKALEGAGVDEKKNLVLRSVHPSPLSASRGFFETGHFKEGECSSSFLYSSWNGGN